MKPARIVFPSFWFGTSNLREAILLARRGVGGFCVYGGTAQETQDFIARMRDASPYDNLLFCADISDNLSEVIKDAPVLPSNPKITQMPEHDAPYRKGYLTARMARSIGINWVLAPVIDLGYSAPAFSDVPLKVTQMAGDFVAGLSNGGVINCIKYFPGVSGTLKTLAQMEDAEFVPYKHLFRRADAIMPSDMTFPYIDNDNQAMLSEKVIQGVLKKRLNYKGCVVSFPLHKGHLHSEETGALHMLRCKVENILAPTHANSIIDAVEKEVERGLLTDEIIHAVSNHELFLSKVNMAPEPLPVKESFRLAEQGFER